MSYQPTAEKSSRVTLVTVSMCTNSRVWSSLNELYAHYSRPSGDKTFECNAIAEQRYGGPVSSPARWRAVARTCSVRRESLDVI